MADDDLEQKTVIGIAFGNTSSSISFTGADGKAELIANEEGDRQIPSVLSYHDDEEYHGAQAKSHLVRHPRNTVAYFRDFLGKTYDKIDPTNAHASAHPLNKDNHAAFSLQEKSEGEPTTVSISEITTRHLKRLKDSASDFLGKPIDGAVITVPTDFTETQRKALSEAAEKCDLHILQIIHEPIAAVLAYSAREDTPHPVDKLTVVVDVGGTRSDVAVVACRGGMFTVLATAHDYELGGVHFDEILVDHFSKEFVKKYKSDPKSNPRSHAKLKLESENTRKTLSLSTSATISIDSLADGFDFHSAVNRTRYDLLIRKLVDQIVVLVETALRKAELDVLDINEVILSGGISHTPKVASRIQSFFPESTAVHAPATSTVAINPSDLAARGAAIQASLVAEFDKEDIEQSTHPAVTVTPHLAKSIGVVIQSKDGEDFHPLLEHGTAVPARRTAHFPAPASGGDVLVRICEGSREIVVSKPEKKQPNGVKDGDDDDSDEDEDEEEEETRIIKHNIGTVLAEAALQGVKKGSKIEVMLNIGGDLGLAIAARVVGEQGGVRGNIDPPAQS